ncbi:asparaginase [Saccharibacillus sp. CPCC 101409]|uniref:asparaginase n=1 Tax=Saccharibacillus sp. CPCC 101409 TaxID=3058041 RepID=UPI002672FC9E|nr:asparaginase [Saccharibacillus sp. CPCC 101409]MDO3410877.1 asparaginase [Saccharibacillus sp. CPCC 101409]
MPQDVQVSRGEYIESNHEIHVAVVDTAGRLLYSVGDPDRLTFPRSSMKPFQAVALLESGAADAYGYGDAEISLSCASHSGEPIHRSTVLDVLSRAGLSENDLQCGTHIPRDSASYRELIREGRELTPVFSNCSGKHSGMLLTAVHLHEDTRTYREIDHPHQQRILSVVSDICGLPAERIGIGVDGCGVPVHRLPLYNAALGFARLAKPEGHVSEVHAESLNRIRTGMTNRPEMVAGAHRFDTDVMRVFGGNLVTKIGAEGVQCIGVADRGIGIVVKVEDGSERATSVAAMEVLKQLGIGTDEQFEELADYVYAPVLNARKERIGEITPNFELRPAGE